MGLTWGGKRSSRSGWFTQDNPTPATAASPCALHSRDSGFLYKTPSPNSFISKVLWKARGCWKLWLRAASGEAGVGMMPLTCACLPGGNITSHCPWILPVPSRHCVVQVCSRWAFAEAQLSHVGVHGGSGPDFPSLSRQRPFSCIQTWIPSQQLQECGRDPLKAMLELLLPPCVSPRYNIF